MKILQKIIAVISWLGAAFFAGLATGLAIKAVKGEVKNDKNKNSGCAVASCSEQRISDCAKLTGEYTRKADELFRKTLDGRRSSDSCEQSE